MGAAWSKEKKKKEEPLRGWRGSSEECSHLFWLLQVIAFFPVVSNKIRVAGEQGQNSRQSQEAVSASARKAAFVISVNQRLSRPGEGGTERGVRSLS